MDTTECVVCDALIEQSYHWLADLYPNLCHNHKNMVYQRRQARFQEHLDHASKIVESWPEWKRTILK